MESSGFENLKFQVISCARPTYCIRLTIRNFLLMVIQV